MVFLYFSVVFSCLYINKEIVDDCELLVEYLGLVQDQNCLASCFVAFSHTFTINGYVNTCLAIYVIIGIIIYSNIFFYIKI
jgi:hypothetical protein